MSASAGSDHNLIIPIAGTFWIVAPLLRFDRRAWISLAVAHLAALFLYVPWLARLGTQSSQVGLNWIRPVWE